MSFLQDLRYGWRMACKSPGFSLVAILVLSLAIGGTTAMFSLINTLVLRPIDANKPEQLVRFYGKEKKPSGAYRGFSFLNYKDIAARNDAFVSVAAFSEAMVGVNEGELTRRTFSAMVSANYFETFGVPLAAGRPFTAEEERPGSASPVVIVSHSHWERMGGDPGFVGKTIRINGRPFEVVGITRPYFTGVTALITPEFFFPLGMYEVLANDFTNERKRQLSDRSHHCLRLIGRLKPDLTAASAQARLEVVASQLAEAFPDANKDYTIQLGRISRLSVNTYPQENDGLGTMSILVMSMSGAVLLIACLNLANMLLARGAARRREIAVRLALGGTRARLVRQLLTEGLLLALVGGIGGLLLSVWATKLLIASLSAKAPFFTVVFDPSPDWRVLLVTFGLCLLCVVFSGLVPALRLSRLNVTSELKEQIGNELRGRSARSLFAPRNLLVAGQLALSLALLTAGGLFARGALAAVRANPGFSFEQNLLVESDVSLAGYDEARGKQAFADTLARLRATPGVQSASLAYLVPFGVFSDGREVERIGGAPAAATGKSPDVRKAYATFNIVTTDYFKTLGIRLLRGREFERLEVDSGRAAKVAIIDEPLARELFKDEEPLGQFVRFADNDQQPMQIVGIVANVKDELTANHVQMHVYVPFGQEYRAGMNFHVRTEPGVPESSMLKSVRDLIRAADPRLPIISLKTFRSFHEEGLVLWFMKTAARLFAIFGAVALFLAVIGIYGVKSYVVSRRTREIGIRMALGAGRGDVLWMVLREGLMLTAAGVCVGLLLSLAVSFGLRSVVYGVSAVDPATFILAPLCLGCAALIACYLPARRATKVQPLAALRYE